MIKISQVIKKDQSVSILNNTKLHYWDTLFSHIAQACLARRISRRNKLVNLAAFDRGFCICTAVGDLLCLRFRWDDYEAQVFGGKKNAQIYYKSVCFISQSIVSC